MSMLNSDNKSNSNKSNTKTIILAMITAMSSFALSSLEETDSTAAGYEVYTSVEDITKS